MQKCYAESKYGEMLGASGRDIKWVLLTNW